MQGKYKVKKVKVKKYVGGSEGVELTPEELAAKAAKQSTLSDIGGIAGGIGAMGIEGLTASKYDGRYTSQLKDENQAVGRGIGAGIGAASNLLVPGLGAVATPILSAAGGAIQRGFQSSKLADIKKNADYKDSIEKANQNIQTDLTSFQAKQYKTGVGKVKISTSPVAESTFNQTKYNTPVTSSVNSNIVEGDKYIARGRAIKAAEDKAGLRNGLNAASYLRSVPTPVTQAVGWGAALGGAAMDAEEIKDNIQAGKTGEAGANIALGATSLLPGGKLFGGFAGKAARGATMINGLKYGSEATSIAKDISQGAKDIEATAKAKYSKGTKVIEIEGKGTPEIHTDKNFNLKNLGTVPHSKGGNKVVAEEGDIVFPTQNSTKKFNEVIEAVMTKDKYKLKKEQNKLPEDKATKYTKGVQKLKSRFDNKTYNTNTTNRYGRFNKYEDAKKALAKGDGSATVFKTDPLGNHKGSVLGYVDPRNTDGSMSFYKHELPAENTPTEAKVTTPTLSQSQIDGRAAEDSYKFPVDASGKPVAPTTNPNKNSNFTNKYNPLELASTAYNLGTGLFGNAEKVNRKEYSPELERYVDTSSNLRREVNTGYKGALSNARNLSAGNANNFRANAQAAANNKFDQINKVDSQEYSKQVDVNNRNVDRINKAKGVNIDLFNTYEDQDAQNRGVKSDALARGFEGLSDIGTRSNMNRNALQAQLINQQTIREGYGNYGKESGVAGTQIVSQDTSFNDGTGASLTPYSNYLTNKKTNSKSKLGVQFKKGSKGINVTRKYKIK